MAEMLTPAELDRLYVILVGSRNPLNIGAAARAMSNFGFSRLRVVHPYDVAFREARSAVDAEPVLLAAEQFGGVAEAVADCTLVAGTAGRAHWNSGGGSLRLEDAAAVVREELARGGKVAILFGSEKVGLSNHDLAYCQLLLRIPTREEHPSMNLGQAAAVVLYEFVRESTGSAPPSAAPPMATSGDRERLIALIAETLGRARRDAQSYDTAMEEKARRLIHHLPLTRSDIHAWMGIVRRVLWKLNQRSSG